MRAACTMQRSRVNTLIVAALLSLLLCPKLHASDWQVDTVDPGGGGKFSSLLVDKFGNAHVSYMDDHEHQLKYAFWDHRLNKWFGMIVDKNCGGFSSMSLDSHQRPHIAYQGYGTGLKYAHWDGSSWKLEILQLNAQLVEFYTSIALDAEDRPSISFYEVFGAVAGAYLLHLQNARWNGQYWAVSTVDTIPGSGKFNSMMSDPLGHFQIAYANVKYENATLRYARWNGESWSVEIVEGAGVDGYSGWSVDAVADKEGVPHITYTDVRNLLVKYASRKEGKWQVQVIDSLTHQGYPDRNGIALDDKGNPYISYYDAGTGILKMAHREGEKWNSEVIASKHSGFTSSLQISNGEIFITYYDEANNSLRCARRLLEADITAVRPNASQSVR
jgi:hypothetical protein